MPAILGHEGAGVVEQVGSAVKNFAVGDQVVLAYTYRGKYPNCRTGQPTSCDSYIHLNMNGKRKDGSHTFFKEDGTPVSSISMKALSPRIRLLA
jgi:aryl-alcohol dehydrogenase